MNGLNLISTLRASCRPILAKFRQFITIDGIYFGESPVGSIVLLT